MGWLVRCSEPGCAWKVGVNEESQAKTSKALHEQECPCHQVVIQWVHPADETIVIGGRGLLRSGKGLSV